MTMIERMRALVASCPFLDEFSSGVRVDYLSEKPGDYGVFPTGEHKVGGDMSGSEIWQYDFTLAAKRWSPNDEERLKSCGFLESFQHWLNGFNRSGLDLGDAEFVSIQGGNGAFTEIDADGQSGTYSILCNLVYERMI